MKARAAHRVLVFPSSNEPGLEVVHALWKSVRFEVVGGSSVALASDPSRALLRAHLECPHLNDADFDERFRALLVANQIDVVFPTVDAIIERLAQWTDPPCALIVPNAVSAALCADKRALYDALDGEPTLPRCYGPSDAVALPAWAKPARGGGGRGAYRVESAAQLEQARAAGLIVQELLTGDEYTVDCIGDAQGTLLAYHARERSKVGRGIALASQTVQDPEIDAAVERIAARLGVSGPFFVQFKRRSDGSLALLEVNARIGGSTTLTRIAGLNTPQLAVHIALGDTVQAPRTNGPVRMVRHLQTHAPLECVDGILWDLDDTLVRKDGKADPDTVARLYDAHNQGLRQWLMTLNKDPRALLAALQIPDFFEAILQTTDKVAELRTFAERFDVALERIVMVNDSNREKLAIQAAFPQVRILTPDAVAALPREEL